MVIWHPSPIAGKVGKARCHKVIGHRLGPDSGAAVGEEEWTRAADHARIALHDGQVGPDVRRQIGLVDD
jgi:hypothetical protein